MTRTTTTAIAVAIATLAGPTAAGAHVTLQPKTAPAGGYVVQDVRVPNETDDATTTKVDVQMPAGFESVSYQAVPGWSVEVTKSGDAVSRVTFTAAKGKGIAPGEFQDFPLSVKMPEEPETLTFKALQTYDDGEVVRWIGAPDSDEPAPQVTVEAATEAVGDGHDATKGETEIAPTAATAPAAAATASVDDGGEGLAVAALVVGGLGLAAGLGALVTTRRLRPRT